MQTPVEPTLCAPRKEPSSQQDVSESPHTPQEAEGTVPEKLVSQTWKTDGGALPKPQRAELEETIKSFQKLDVLHSEFQQKEQKEEAEEGTEIDTAKFEQVSDTFERLPLDLGEWLKVL